MANLELRCILGETIPKAGETVEGCQDAIGVNEESQLFGISDGVARSLFSGLWARLLSSSFCLLPVNAASGLLVNRNDDWRAWTANVQEEWWSRTNEIVGRRHESERQLLLYQLAEGRYAAATFIGLQTVEAHGDLLCRAMIVGDSCLFITRNRQTSTQVYKSSPEFDAPPKCLRSRGIESDAPEFLSYKRLLPGDRILLATDGLARWLISLREQQPKHFREVMDLVFSIKTRERLQRFIDAARAYTAVPMEDDDVGFITLEVREKRRSPFTKKTSLEDTGRRDEHTIATPPTRTRCCKRLADACAIVLGALVAGVLVAYSLSHAIFGDLVGEPPGRLRAALELLPSGTIVYSAPGYASPGLLEVTTDVEVTILARNRSSEPSWTSVDMSLWLPEPQETTAKGEVLIVEPSRGYMFVGGPRVTLGVVPPGVRLPIIRRVLHEGVVWYICRVAGYVPGER